MTTYVRRFAPLAALVLSVGLLAYAISLSSAFAATCNPDTLVRVQYGQSSSAVANLQACLIVRGYSIPAGATGYYGSQTQAAVLEFYEEEFGLTDMDGTSVGPQGRARLGQAQTVTTLPNPDPNPTPRTVTRTEPTIETYSYKRATDAEELKAYMNVSGSYYTQTDIAMGAMEMSIDDAAGAQAARESSGSSNKSSRHSSTNVQVVGIDEPDVVKTDGEHLFISRQNYWRGSVEPVMFADDAVVGTVAPEYQPPSTTVVDAYPLSDLAVISDEAIEESGEMLLVDDRLLVFASDKVVAYDVRNPESPEKKWERDYGERTSLRTARLKGDTVYLITATSLNRSAPCPPVPLLEAGMILPCTSVWIPEREELINTSYSIMALNPRTGKVQDSLTVAGEGNNTVIAMFEDNIYLTHRLKSSEFEVMLDFLEYELTDLIPASVRERIREIRSYNISDESKMSEVTIVLDEWRDGITDDEYLRFENEAQNRLDDYMEERLRDIDRTAVMRISVGTLTVRATKTIPGHLFNQFSLDEYDSYLRTAVTVGDRWGAGEQVNDVYVLDRDLDLVGSITDLGITEQIYSARFIGDRGYVVTFRQIDPFYVLDLSDPNDPRMVGELKIPGFSSYLEAIDNDTVLGVGQDGGNVKLTLFDVSNPALPREADTYILKEYWTEVNSNHHAFLRDSKHKVVFIPGGNGGYVFGYSNDTLSLKAAVAGYSVKRAVFIDDYLYVVGDDEITVLDENTWKEEATLEL